MLQLELDRTLKFDKVLQAANSNHDSDWSDLATFAMQVFGVKSLPPFGKMGVSEGTTE